MSEHETPFERIAAAEKTRKDAEEKKEFGKSLSSAMRAELLTRIAEKLSERPREDEVTENKALETIADIKSVLQFIESDPIHNTVDRDEALGFIPEDELIEKGYMKRMMEGGNDTLHYSFYTTNGDGKRVKWGKELSLQDVSELFTQEEWDAILDLRPPTEGGSRGVEPGATEK